jgi:hypothetical protein
VLLPLLLLLLLLPSFGLVGGGGVGGARGDRLMKEVGAGRTCCCHSHWHGYWARSDGRDDQGG